MTVSSNYQQLAIIQHPNISLYFVIVLFKWYFWIRTKVVFFVLGDTDLGTDFNTFSVHVEKCSRTDGNGDAALNNR